MEDKSRIALIGIIVETPESIDKMNTLLSQFGEHIVGRMGIPYRQKDISVISVVVDAPQNIISSLSGKLGMLKGITTKTMYSTK
ncbi:MAG TPA: iron-only hydrogenase system regulator [Clostridiales bacterium]|nr:iron-only hydrogenase system regulator [Clostridiales bacterium]